LPAGANLPDPVNVIRMALHPDWLKPRICNWEQVARILTVRIRTALRVPEPDAGLVSLYEEILTYPDVAQAERGCGDVGDTGPVLPMEIEFDAGRISWFSTIATIGTPHDVTVEGIIIESMFPADESSESVFRSLRAD
jgi:hypothetical protein